MFHKIFNSVGISFSSFIQLSSFLQMDSSQQLTSLLCPGCTQKFDTVDHQPFVSTGCGHSVCGQCCRVRSLCIVCRPPNPNKFSPFTFGNMSDYRIEWKLNLSLLDMIRISEENERELKQQSLLEKTVAVQQMEREKRMMEIEKEREIEEMSKECKLVKEKMETETRRADELSLHSIELSFRASQAETELNELKMKCERELPNSIDYVVCNDCLDEFKRKNMKICMEWADGKPSSPPPILCGFCVFEKHSNHRVIDYLPHLINDSFSSVVANGNLTSTNSQTESSKKMEKGYECMEKWRKELNKFSNAVDLEEISYRDSLEIASSLRNETDVILRANNGVLPILEEFAKTVQESSARLLVLHLSHQRQY